MLSHFLTTAVRYFLKQKVYAAINLFGLSLGLAIVILIGLWINDELGFDKFNANKNSVVQIYENQTYDDGQIFTFGSTPGPLAENLKKDFPEVKEFARATWDQRLLFQSNDKNIYETGIYADASMFRIFTFPLIEGDVRNIFRDNNSVAISDKLAKKFFGSSSAIGKSFRINSTLDAKVCAVFHDIPKSSSVEFEFVLPYEKYLVENDWLQSWGNNGIQTFLLLEPGTSQPAFEVKIKGYVKKFHAGSVVDLIVNPMADWHLYRYNKGVRIDGRILYVRIFALVAAFILLIACINFMNMATARASLRMKEVGIRKVSGAQRRSIILQFLGESVLTTFIALVIALGAAMICIPIFNDISQKSIEIPLNDIRFILSLLCAALVTGVLAGSYPAFYLSSFQPAHVLKGRLTTGGGSFPLRKGLVVFQFFLSIVLIISSLVVARQVDYVRSKDLGFQRENILSFNSSGAVGKNHDAFRNQLLSIPGVVSVGRSTTQPFSIGSSTAGIDWDGKPKESTILFQIAKCDYTFFPALGMQFISGRNFSPSNAADTSNFIVTEEAAKLMNMDEPLGRRLRWDGKEGQIVGVLKNFHAWNLHYGMQPVVFGLNPSESSISFVKIEGGDTEQTVDAIADTFRKFESDFPFEFKFFDDQVNQMYRLEVSIGRLVNIFSFMAIVISCLGLFALASFTAERRTKEIGIRKVLGATVAGLVLSLCREFLTLVMIAILAGIPLAWFAMRSFLDLYVFHTDLPISVFITAAVMLLSIALATVVWQATRASLINPATSLRSE